MKTYVLALLLGVLGLGLAGCAEVEGLYETACTDVGGTWSSTDGCTGVSY